MNDFAPLSHSAPGLCPQLQQFELDRKRRRYDPNHLELGQKRRLRSTQYLVLGRKEEY